MGKNRKARQVVNQTDVEFEDNTNDPSAPVEFLTSDDFQVVHKKRHNSKKSPDDQEEKEFLPRSRTSSCRFTDAEDAIGCHSGFWGIKSQKCALGAKSVTDEATENIDSHQESKQDTENCNGFEDFLENGGGDCLLEVCNGMQKVCLNGGNVEKSKKIDDDIDNWSDEHSENVFNFERPSLEESTGKVESGDGKEMNAKAVKSSDERNEVASSNKAESKDISESISSQIDRFADISPEEVISPEREDSVTSQIPALKCNTSKTTSKKKKQRKVRAEQNSNGFTTSEEAGKLLTKSSSSEFSEVLVSNNNEHDSKEKDNGKKDRKRPSKKQLAAIHNALMKAKVEEERRKQEEEAQRKLSEEAEKLALEKEKLEQQKKEKKKVKRETKTREAEIGRSTFVKISETVQSSFSSYS